MFGRNAILFCVLHRRTACSGARPDRAATNSLRGPPEPYTEALRLEKRAGDKGRAHRPLLSRRKSLFDVKAGDRAGDDEALDLRGSLEDRVDLRVAVHPLDRELAGVAVAAEDLDRPLGHPNGDLAGFQPRHRALGVFESVAVAAHPGGAPDQQPGGVDLELHVRQVEGDRLVLDDLPTELFALFGVLERVLVGRPGDPERLRADGRAARLEGLHRRLRFGLLALADAGQAFVELVFAAKQAGARDAAVVEVDVGGVGGAQAVLLDLGALL